MDFVQRTYKTWDDNASSMSSSLRMREYRFLAFLHVQKIAFSWREITAYLKPWSVEKLWI